MGWHLIQNKENYMKKKDLILAGAVLLLAGILALALRLPKTENGNTMKVTVPVSLSLSIMAQRRMKRSAAPSARHW